MGANMTPNPFACVLVALLIVPWDSVWRHYIAARRSVAVKLGLRWRQAAKMAEKPANISI